MIAAIAWDNYQGRTQALAVALGGTAWYLRSRPTRRQLLLVRYAIDAIKMWRLLRAHRPHVLLIVTPPVVPPLIGWLWCSTHDCRLVIDCHTGAFHSPRWEWLSWLLKLACRRARATLVHTEEDEARVQAWGASVVLLPDELPDPALATPTPPCADMRVVVAGSLDVNEPVAETLQAARLIPQVEVRLTGDPTRVPAAIRRGAPANVVFTGWLRYPDFLGELLTAPVVAVFSTDPHIMNRAAFEAIGLGRPLVLSDLPGLRKRFAGGALFSPNEPPMMAAALTAALAQREALTARSVELRGLLQTQHDLALTRLKALLQPSRPFTPGELSGEVV